MEIEPLCWNDIETRNTFKGYIQLYYDNEYAVLTFCDYALLSFAYGQSIFYEFRYNHGNVMYFCKKFIQSLESAELFLECIDEKNIHDDWNFSMHKQMLKEQWEIFHTLSLPLQNSSSEKIPNGK